MHWPQFLLQTLHSYVWMARVSLVEVTVSIGEADAVVRLSARASVESFIVPLWR
jgi:hypothetical protein